MDLDKKDLGKLIGAAKRIWTGNKTIRVPLDKIDRQESSIFANDYQLAKMVKEKQELDQMIVEHIDQSLEKSRGYNAVELRAKQQDDALGRIERIATALPGLIDSEEAEKYIRDLEKVKIVIETYGV